MKCSAVTVFQAWATCKGSEVTHKPRGKCEITVSLREEDAGTGIESSLSEAGVSQAVTRWRVGTRVSSGFRGSEKMNILCKRVPACAWDRQESLRERVSRVHIEGHGASTHHHAPSPLILATVLGSHFTDKKMVAQRSSAGLSYRPTITHGRGRIQTQLCLLHSPCSCS